ncbi:MAG: tetratricopeptide repeat protein [Gemmatimonadales bacterium]|nr:tetratricopeptide repeat protein [Gemmatimonadales bacterium]
MAIKGSLKEASLPDVIQLLFLGRRTGCLALADRHNFGTVYFDEGQIVYASIVNRRDRLGDILVRSGRISAEQLQLSVDRQSGDREHKLGEILVELGALSREELERYIQLQIEEAVYYLFTWTSGTFNFEAGVRPEREDFLVRINPEYLLLEGARRVDEWSLIEKKIPSFDLIFAVDRVRLEQSAPDLSSEQRQLILVLDGNRDVQQVIEETGLVEFEVGKALFGLITAGFAHRVGTSAAAAPKVNDSRLEEHRNLGIAFYKAAMFDEALREFRRVADLRASDASAPFYLGLIALRQARWDQAADAFRQALERGGPRPAALHNLGFALERLGRLQEAEEACAHAAGRAREDHRVMLGWGVVALKQGVYQVAQGRLTKALELLGERPAPALWHWAVTLVTAGLDDQAGALKAARAGVAAYPTSAVLQNNLAVLLELSGDVRGAEAVLRTALGEDASLPQVSKNLADVLYRNGRYDEAREAYERAAKLAPELGDDLYFKLGNIAYKSRDHARARQSWSQATALNPGHELARTNLEMLDLAQ